MILGVVGDGPNLGLARGDVPEGSGLRIGKTAELSPVHRRARMDSVSLRRRCGRVIGLFTTQRLRQPASSTPLLHRKLAQILTRLDLIEGSHDYKAAVALFDAFPKDELFAAPPRSCGRGRRAAGAAGRRVRLLGRLGTDGRSVVADPAAAARALQRASCASACATCSPALRRRRRRRRTTCSARATACSVHFLVHAADGLPEVSTPRARARGRELARTWDDELREELVERVGDEPRARCSPRAGRARCPSHYKASTAAELAAARRRVLRAAARPASATSSSACRTTPDEPRRASRSTSAAPRSSSRPGDADARGPRAARDRGDPDAAARRATSIWVQEFRVLGAGRPAARPRRASARASRSCIARRLARRGGVGHAQPARGRGRPGLARRSTILRAYRKYRQRIGSRFTESYQNDVLVANPALTAKLVRYFELRFDPERAARRGRRDGAARGDPRRPRRRSSSLDHDRILRNQLGLIDATLRTNAYTRGPRRDGVQAALRRRAGDPAAARRCSRSTSTRPRWRASTCAAARSRAAASAGRTAWTTAPRSSA